MLKLYNTDDPRRRLPMDNLKATPPKNIKIQKYLYD